MRSLLLVALLLGLSPGSTAGEPATTALTMPATWLVAPSPDRGGRRPVRPSAMIRRYLLAPDAAPPKAGDEVVGERGKPVTWRALAPDREGRIDPSQGGPRASWAYLSVEVKRRSVWIATLRNGARLYVNGVPFVGDVYGYGSPGIPVELTPGINHVYLAGFRGEVTFTLRKPPGAAYIPSAGAVLPDLPAKTGLQSWIGVRAVNATREPKTLRVRLEENDHVSARTSLPLPVCPLGSIQAPLNVSFLPAHRPTDQAFPIAASIEVDGSWHAGQSVSVRARTDEQRFLHTFRSQLDDSIQTYGLRMPRHPTTNEPGLVLSLHGAGVPPRNQVGAYGSKADLWLAVPTNRGAFGFDWQDWGRLDAYEVLEHLLRELRVSRDRVYLTGHSMGGHGAWHLAANDPDTFAAVAPCAAWISFDTYGGRPAGSLQSVWHAADAASLTLNLIDNLAALPTFVLHGEEDKTVPVSEAKKMLAALKEAGGRPQHHFEPGKGHWYDTSSAPGADCVDWPEIFDLFRKSRRKVPDQFRWVSVDAGTDSVHHWVSLWQPRVYGKPMRVEARYDPTDRSAEIKTTNVAYMSLQHPRGFTHIRLDDAVLPSPPSGRIWFQHEGGGWRPARGAPAAAEKHPRRQGPLRQGMRKRFVFVYGTAGRTEETAALLARARFDAQTWMYRAQGQGLVLTDRQLLDQPAAYADRDVVLYGNRDTNAAWSTLVADTCPIRVRRGRLDFAGRTWRGDDLGAAYVYPRRGSETASVVCLADTGARGTRVGSTLALFVSGAGFPDYIVYGADVLEKGDDGVLATGWFDARWQLQPGGHLRK